MKIIRNYILKECIPPFIMALFVLTCVFLLGNLLQLANLVINKGVGLKSVGQIFFLMIPVLLGYTIPIACMVGVIMTFSRLSADNEIIALRANGIHLWKILAPILAAGIIISLLSFILNDRIIPYAHHKQRKMLKTLGVENPTALLEAGVFIHSFDNQIIFIHKIDGNHLKNITIYQPQKDGPTRTIIARSGEFTQVPGKEQIKLKLIDGTSDEPNLENPSNFYKLNFKNYFMNLDFSKGNKKIEKKPKSMTLNELKQETDRLERLFVDPARIQTEYFRKITLSFAPFVFILLGFPIAVITNRREKSANVVVAMGFAACYYLLSLGCEALSIKSVFPSMFIMWFPNMIGIMGATLLNCKCVS
ncbi:MAG: LptF/LptG family permease [Candidatus Zapsychrus exili]|nr:LptF/LptG family permease [Candidatus Zapsychrus exili]